MSYPLVVFAVLGISFVHQWTFGFGYGFAARSPERLQLDLDASKFDVNVLEKRSIEQPLDHFNSSEKRILRLFYSQKLDLWQTNGPIYITYGREWVRGNKTLIYHLAKETNGAMYAIEVRYFFSSLPKIPKNNLTEYFKYFGFRQDMADLAYFIKFLKSDPKYKSSKVVVIGAAYMANFAVWSRELYPDLVDAAVSAGEAVLAQTDFKEYFGAITNIYRKYGGEMCIVDMAICLKAIQGFLQSSDGIVLLKKWLNICPESDLTVLENQQLLFNMYYSSIAGEADQGNPKTINETCNDLKLTDNFNTKLNFLKLDRSGLYSRECIDVNYTSWFNDTDPFLYNMCSQSGTFVTTTAEKEPFVRWNPLKFELNACQIFFNEDLKDIEKRVDEGVARTNKMFGGNKPNVTKVVFSTGDFDPWHILGVQQDLGPEAPVYVINGTGAWNLLYYAKREPEELTKHREHVKELIKKWISP